MAIGTGASADITSRVEGIGSNLLSVSPGRLQFGPHQVTPSSIAMAFGFSAAVGVFFGIYPAWRASRLRPHRSSAV